MRATGTRTVLMSSALLVLAAAPPVAAQETPMCFGRPATIHDPDREVVSGTSRDDVIVGHQNNYELRGLGGNDLICQGPNPFLDVIRGNGGDDRIKDNDRAGGGHNLFGGPGDDVIDAVRYNNLFGGPGDDRLVGGSLLNGGLGDDVLVQSELDDHVYLVGGGGKDVLDGRLGFTTVDYRKAPHGVRVDLAAGTARGMGRDRLMGVEGIEGSRFDDVLLGSDAYHGLRHALSRSNDIEAGPGDDVLYGRGRGDDLDGGTGRDRIFGGDGNDSLQAGEIVEGHRTPNLLVGGRGDDGLQGARGPDELRGGPGDDGLNGYSGRNVVLGGPGADIVDYLGGSGPLVGGAGSDTLSFGVFGPVTVDLAEQTVSMPERAFDVKSFENVWGSYYGDVLIGDAGPNLIYDGGNYNVDGDEEQILAGDGDDIVALAADDSGDVQDTSFSVDGGEGADILTFELGWSPATIDLASGSARAGLVPGTVAGIESVVGTKLDDNLTGNDAPNAFAGWKGDDTIAGAGGNDALHGGPGTDRLDGGDGVDDCIAGETNFACEKEAESALLPSEALRPWGWLRAFAPMPRIEAARR